jgi:hypothetical protein
MGGVGGAFARHADQVAASVPPQLLRAIMARLVTPEGTRAVVDHRELLSLSVDQHEIHRILDQLVRARLIHLHTDPDQVATVEIVHEMLITEWPTLQRWLQDSHAMRGFMHELRQAARQWASRGKPADLVWRGATANQALGHANRQLLDLSLIEKEFLAAVRTHAARTRRRKVLIVTSVAIALGLVFAGGSFALVRIKLAERQAQEEKRQAVDAKKQAEADRKQAEIDRTTAVSAKAELQGKLDIIAEKERQRLAAEDKVAAANKSEEMTKEQLAETNKVLERKVAEAQAAKDKAQANEALAQRATSEAQVAKRKVEDLLAQKRAEIERLKAASKDIYSGDLNRSGAHK